MAGSDGPLAIARRFAAAHPGATLPCPACAAAVNAVNLDRHLKKVHPDPATLDRATRVAWLGPERLVLRPLVIIPVLFVAGVITWSWRSDQLPRPWFLVAAGVVAVSLLLSGLAVADVRLFRGRLSVDGAAVRLRHTFGLATRTLHCVDRVEVGAAYRLVSDSTNLDIGSGSSEVPAGAFLRLFDGRRSITVHCRTGGSVRKSWTGWQPGRRRRRWDVTLGAADFVGLQYALAEAGRLQIRS